MTKEDMIEMEYQFPREVPGRGWCGLHRQAFTVGLFYGINEDFYTGRYCFHNAYDALVAILLWDGEGHPGDDWVKHKGRGFEEANRKFFDEEGIRIAFPQGEPIKSIFEK